MAVDQDEKYVGPTVAAVDHVAQSDQGEHTRIAIHTDTYDISEDTLGRNLPKRYWWSPGFIGTVLALCCGNISQYLGFIMPSNSLAVINVDIGPSTNITWVSLGYTLGLSVGFLVIGRLSDIFGRRWFLILGNLLALIGSIVSGTATTVDQVVGGSVLAGLAGAVQLQFVAAIAELVPNKHRPIWVAAVFASSFEIACFGPVIAKNFVEHTARSWRWSYYLNIIVSAFTVCLLFFLYHPPGFKMLHRNRTRIQQFKRMDYIGFVIFTGGLILFIMGLSWGGDSYPWKSAHVIVTIVVGFVLLVFFVLYDAFLHKGDPLLPAHLFKSRGFLPMIACGTVGSCVYYSMQVLWPQQISYLFIASPEHVGWLSCVVGASTLVGQILGGALCRYIHYHRYILMYATVTLTIFSAAMVSIGPGDESLGVGLMFMACCSVGIIETVSMALIPLSCPPEDIATSLGMLGSSRSGGASVATAIYTTILANKLADLTPPLVSSAALKAGLPASSLSSLFTNLASGMLGDVPGINANIITAVTAATAEAAAESFRYVWYAVIAFACVAIIASYFTIDYREYMTMDISRKLVGKTTHVRDEDVVEERV
ncbi:hypothetical protein MMC08_001118 [Hypocenomyce scalaris]|nr:hypothetical protein [Hypocenomyce scalaris]